MYVTRLVRSSFQTAADVVVDGVLPVVLTSERYVVGLIRQHLAQLDDATSASATVSPRAEATALASPTDVLQSLLDRAIYNSPDDSLDDLHQSLCSRRCCPMKHASCRRCRMGRPIPL
jgi:hypothetical protein